MTEKINNFLPLKLEDVDFFIKNYDEFPVIETSHSQEEPVLYLTFRMHNDFPYKILFKKIEGLEERLNYVRKAFNTQNIYPIFEMMYCPFIWNATEDSELREQIVLFFKFADTNYNFVNWEKIKELFPDEYYNPCVSNEHEILPEIFNMYCSYSPSSLKINFDFNLEIEEEFIKLFNYLFFLKTKKTVYEELLENSFMFEGWFPTQPEDIWDITSLKGIIKLKVFTLQRLHRQTLTHYDNKKSRIYK